MTKPPPSRRSVCKCNVSARTLSVAWMRYQKLFGLAPRGTETQFAAMLEFIPGRPRARRPRR